MARGRQAARAKKDQEPQEEEKMEVTRREALNLAWLASLGIFLIPFGGSILVFAYPRFKEGDFGGDFVVGNFESLPAVGDDPVANAIGKFWLTRTEDGLRAIYKVCTHLGCLYNWQDQEFKFICPCHGSQFSYESVRIQGPAPRNLDLFTLEARRGGQDGELLHSTADPNSAIPVIEEPDVIYIVKTGAKINGLSNADQAAIAGG
jgi:cytochrome b6-f complex iron-sulfur subunit